MQHGAVGTHPVKGNAIFLQNGRRYQRHLVAEEGVTALGAAREEACRGRQQRQVAENPDIPTDKYTNTRRRYHRQMQRSNVRFISRCPSL